MSVDERLVQTAIEQVANISPDERATTQVEAERYTPVTPSTFQQEVGKGVDAGMAGLQSSTEYFAALANTLVGDEKAANDRVIRANMYEQEASEALAGMESFGEFVENPTFEGFFTQLASGVGQAVPSAVTTIGSALATGGASLVAQLAGRAAISATSKVAAKRLIKDAVDNAAKGTASPDEKAILQGVYSSLRGLTFKRGAIAGATASSFVPLSGQNFSEGIESGREMDTDLAVRSLLVAAPQAALDVAGEALLLKSFANLAKKKATTDSGILAQFARDVSKATARSAGVEAVTEGSQEAIGGLNRAAMDDTFTSEDLMMRIAEGAFLGAAGGAGLGAAGGTLGSTASIMQQAKTKLDESRDQRVDSEIDREQFGDIDDGFTTEEPAADISAQVEAVFDDNSSKNAVWIAGEISDQYRAAIPEDNTPVEITVGGRKMTAAYVPGRGIILSKNRAIVEGVVSTQASDAALQGALGYSNTKPEDGDIVVQALNSEGKIVSEEVTNADGLADALAAAEQLSPVGQVRKTSLKDALADRKRRLEAERGPDIRAMDDEDVLADLLAEMESQDGSQTLEVERTESQTYNQKTDPAQVFPNTETSRAEYDAVFGETNWDDPYYAGMTEALLRKAVDEQQAYPTFDVRVELNDGKYTVVREGIPVDPTESSAAFLVAATNKASRSKFARDSQVVVVPPEGSGRKPVKVNMADLVNAGRELVFKRAGTTYQGDSRAESAKKGLRDILADLQIEGYDVLISGTSLYEALGNNRTSVPDAMNVTAAVVDGKQTTINELLSPTKTVAPDKVKQLLVFEQTDNQNADPVVARVIRGTDEQLDRYEADFKRSGFDTRRVGGEFDPGDVSVEEATQGGEIEAMRTAGMQPGELRTGLNLEGGQPDLRTGRAPSTNTAAPARAPRTEQQPEGDQSRAADQIPLEAYEQDAAIDAAEPTPEQRRDQRREEAKAKRDQKARRSETTTPQPEQLELPGMDQTAEQAQQTQGLDSALSGIVDALVSAIKLAVPPKVVTVTWLENATDADIAAAASTSLEEQTMRQLRDEMRAKPSVRGMYSRTGNMIVIRESGNALQDALVMSHEYGHALYKELQDSALSNRAIRVRLLQAFRKDPKYRSYLDKYGRSVGFDEWHADQTARWANKKFSESAPKNMTDRYFKNVVRRMRELYKSLSDNVRTRLDGELDQDFATYMDAVIEAKKQTSNLTPDMFVEKAIVRDIKDNIEASASDGGASRIRTWQRVVRDFMNNGNVKPLLAIFRTADGRLRSIAGSRVANMFYGRSQDSKNGKLGMILAAARSMDGLRNKLEDSIGSLDDPTVQATVEEAASSVPNDQLSPEARKVREFLDSIYDDYIEPSNSNIGRQTNYFPVVLDLAEIDQRFEEFVALVVANQPGITADRVRTAMHAIARQSRDVDNDVSLGFDPTNPSAQVEKDIQLTKGIDRKILQDAGFLRPPTEALASYIKSVVKRVEWNRATKDEQGNDQLKGLLDGLSPESRAEALDIISSYLGYQSKPLSPFWRKVNSYGQFVQFVTILPFATLASIPELAGPLIASKEFSDVTTAFKEIAKTISNRAEAAQFARDIGVTSSEVMANAWATQAEQEFMDTKVRKMSDAFFRAIGLSYFTNFTREFAAGMGMQFILKHAENEFNNPRAERYLSELGLTAADVKAWDKGGRKFDTAEGRKVKAGLQRFVESSILRPNAAERPLWASDPHWALVWQLKSFMYSYSKVILGGVIREAKARRAEGTSTGMAQLTATTGILALTAMATLPLAMMAMELREYAKYGLAWALPGIEPTERYFRSDRMDWPTYAGEIFDRAGFMGPFAIAGMMNQNAEWGKNPLMPLLGPTAESLEVILSNGFDVGKTLSNRFIPVYSSL